MATLPASRRADLFPDARAEDRFSTSATVDERTMLLDFLRAQRATLELKCVGLADELARRAVEPSTLSLLGLVRHLADVERGWFRRTLAGQDAPPRFSSETAPDQDFDGAAPDPALVTEAWRAWHEEVAFAEEFVAGAPHLDISGVNPWRGPVSLRWVLIHMIEEYARHNGHVSPEEVEVINSIKSRLDGDVAAHSQDSNTTGGVVW